MKKRLQQAAPQQQATVLQQAKLIFCLIMEKKKIKSSVNHLFAYIHEIHLSIPNTATTAAEIYLFKNKSLCMY